MSRCLTTLDCPQGHFRSLFGVAVDKRSSIGMTPDRDAGIAHGLTTHPQQIGRLGVLDQLRHQIDTLHQMIFCGGGKPGLHATGAFIDLDRSLGEQGRLAEV